MKSTFVCLFLLALTSTSIGTPLKFRSQRQWGPKGVEKLSHNVVDIQKENQLGDKNENGQNGLSLSAPPKSFDWRDKGVISPVKNQGSIGDPVAFSAVECVESLVAIQSRKVVELSIPEVSDCCQTRLLDNKFDCIHNIGGLCSAATYPVLTGHCRNGSCQAAAQIQGGKQVPAKQVEDMVESLLVCPLLVYIDAGRPSFDIYEGGVYSDPDCKDMPDHALQVVGYGEEGGQEYWICKNSWGENWGEKGYIRIAKGVDMCGIESHAQYPY